LDKQVLLPKALITHQGAGRLVIMHFITLKSVTIVASVLFGATAALPVAGPRDQLLSARANDRPDLLFERELVGLFRRQPADPAKESTTTGRSDSSSKLSSSNKSGSPGNVAANTNSGPHPNSSRPRAVPVVPTQSGDSGGGRINKWLEGQPSNLPSPNAGNSPKSPTSVLSDLPSGPDTSVSRQDAKADPKPLTAVGQWARDQRRLQVQAVPLTSRVSSNGFTNFSLNGPPSGRSSPSN